MTLSFCLYQAGADLFFAYFAQFYNFTAYRF